MRDLTELLDVMKSLGIDRGDLGLNRDPGSDRAQGSTPFSPEDARRHKVITTPKEVIDSVNELLAEKFKDGPITIRKTDLVDRIMSRLSISRQEIIARGFLEIEPVYEDAGWKVQFHSPTYDESFEPYYIFEKRT